MPHSRLRRRMRRLVDHLSLPVLVSSIHLRSGLTNVFSSGWYDRDRSHSPRFHLRFANRRVHLSHRRSFALLGALVAISLEVCGCELTHGFQVPLGASTPVDGTRSPVGVEQRLSFYEPVDSETQMASTIRSNGDVLPPVRPPVGEAKPLPWAIPESVYFLYKGGGSGQNDPGRQPIATAFVLSVPDREHRRFFRFLVTARHVIDPEWARCDDKNPASISLRLNRRSGGTGYVTISLLSRENRHYLTPSDSTADLAVIPIDENVIPNLNEYKFIDVPFRLLPTDSETLQFRADQPVITARVPPWPSNGSGSYPVFDAGVLSKMPAETVKVECGSELERQQSKPLHVWFINAATPQGASGAPVYTAMARGAGLAKSTVLLGVQSVAWPDEGAAGITPSFALRDLIQIALRKEKVDPDLYKGPNASPRESPASVY